MPVYELEKQLILPRPLHEIWDFIATPVNLKAITPAYMGFDILGTPAPVMYEGMIIRYRVTPLLGIPMTWITEITHLRPGEYFVDEQRSGPYTLWHHEHHLQQVAGGTLMTDRVHYSPPLGIVGALANRMIIAGRLEEIFAFRTAKLEEIFGKYGA